MTEVAAKQSQIQRESSCRELKDNFVHHWGFNSMRPTTSTRCSHVSTPEEGEEEEEGDGEEHNAQLTPAALALFFSWKAFRKTRPDLKALCNRRHQGNPPTPTYKPPHSRPNIPPAGPCWRGKCPSEKSARC